MDFCLVDGARLQGLFPLRPLNVAVARNPRDAEEVLAVVGRKGLESLPQVTVGELGDVELLVVENVVD